MNKLRVEYEEKEYQKMISNNLKDKNYNINNNNDDNKEIKHYLSTIANMLLSVASVAYALWRLSYGWDSAYRTLFSFFGALLILIAEVVVYIGYISRINRARSKERVKREEKKIVQSIIIPAAASAITSASLKEDSIATGYSTKGDSVAIQREVDKTGRD